VFIEAKDDEGGSDNWSYKSCKDPVKPSPPTNQHPVLYRPEVLPVTQTNSVKAKLTTINNGWVNYYFTVTTTGHNTTKANIACCADVAFLCESGPVYDWLAM